MIKDIINANEQTQANSKQIDALRQAFPACFDRDGRFDMEVFAAAIAGKVDVQKEGYELKFLGKGYAKLLASIDTTTVIVPDEAHNELPENKNSENIYISGDNLDAIKHLLKSYAGKIKCIYIDPPYNTGSDGFVYNDKFNYTVSQLMEKLSIGEDEAQRILDVTNGKSASHSAWLMFMYPRLALARDLLSKDGVIFISIDDNEQANLKLLCDGIFGEDSFAGSFPWRKRTAKSDVPFGISVDYESVLCYARTEVFLAGITKETRKYYETPDFPGKLWRYHDLTKQTTAHERPNSYFTIVNPKNGEEYHANPNRTWAVTADTFPRYMADDRIIFPGDYDFLNIQRPVLRYWQEDDKEKAGDNFGMIAVSTKLPDDIGMTKDGTQEVIELFSEKVFGFPKPVGLVRYLVDVATGNDSIILDFFSGSATTAHAVMELNAENADSKRKYIMVQLPEETRENSTAYNAGYKTIDAIGQERIKRAAAKLRQQYPDTKADLGFKHFTLKDYADDQMLLDKLESFDPQVLFDEKPLIEQFGVPTALATWLVHDNYGLNAACKNIKLADYEAYWCKKHIYLLNEGFSSDALDALITKICEDDDFNPEQIVVFGYSLSFTELENLKVNIKTLNKDNKNLTVQVRY